MSASEDGSSRTWGANRVLFKNHHDHHWIIAYYLFYQGSSIYYFNVHVLVYYICFHALTYISCYMVYIYIYTCIEYVNKWNTGKPYDIVF